MAKCRHHWRKSAVCKTLVVWFCIYFINSFCICCVLFRRLNGRQRHTRALSAGATC